MYMYVYWLIMAFPIGPLPGHIEVPGHRQWRDPHPPLEPVRPLPPRGLPHRHLAQRVRHRTQAAPFGVAPTPSTGGVPVPGRSCPRDCTRLFFHSQDTPPPGGVTTRGVSVWVRARSPSAGDPGLEAWVWVLVRSAEIFWEMPDFWADFAPHPPRGGPILGWVGG